MSNTKALPLKIISDYIETIFVPESLFRTWVINKRFPEYIAFGSERIPCKPAPHPDKKNEYLLSEDCFQALSLPYEGVVHVFQHDNTLHIGPLVGIFTAGFQSSSLRPIGERSMFFARLLSSEQKVGSYYFVFGAHHVNWESATVKGYFYTGKGWKQVTVPFPNVVYNRLPNRRIENVESFQKLKERFEKDYLIPWFNPSFFDKWDIYIKLMDDKGTAMYLPESFLNPTNANIEQLLEKHHHVYLKPAAGSLGLGIHQIIKLKDDPYYYCRFRKDEQNRLRRYSSLERLMKQHFPNGVKNFIAQQGIHLIKIKNNPVDFRIHTNKDEQGKWQISAIAAKVAGKGSVTTHVKSGGEIKTAAETITEAGLSKEQLEELKECALQISKRIDHTTEGFIGEIGFDLGIDKSGHIWMFEANSKPGRTIFSHAKLRHNDLMSRRLPLAYAVYLAKQSITQPELLLT
ncbi:YheC/YheD family endospore coat-associated protein [Bacillus sp. FJAT-45350]|uniref:YheC/YheD family endospore coat-associated protein n=1 Tax=Bacillus sp. FJAT-45350 TaxID=2011014 RepID=UPI000BB95868|nr:YheC/YheD family protein [Bacillus sp. FJAT-45350]